MAKLSGLIECVDKKKKKACLRAPSGKQWRAGRAEKGAHCCKGTQCSGTLVQVFWWIRHALCRESMHSGTKKAWVAVGRGYNGAPDTCLASDHGMALKSPRSCTGTGHLRRFGFKKRDSRFFHASRVRPNDKLFACWHVSGVTDGGGGDFTLQFPSQITVFSINTSLV